MSVSLESLMRRSAIEVPSPGIAAQLLSFIVIGGLAAGSFVLLSTAMIGLGTGAPDWLVSAGSYALFIVPVYLAHRRFSFASSAPHREALPRYVAVQMAGLLLASLFSYVAYATLHLPTVFAATLVIGLTSGVNFMVLRAWAFAANR